MTASVETRAMARPMARPMARGAAATGFALLALAAVIASTLREPLAVRSPVSRSKVDLGLAIAKVQKPGAMAAAAQQLARRDPLQAAAFVMAGIDRLQRNPDAYDAVRSLMQTAVKRQPTFEPALVWLAADHARRGEFNPSLELFDQVLSISNEQLDGLLPVLTVLMQGPESRAAVLARLARYPAWRSALVARAIQTRSLPEPVIVQLLAAKVPAAYAQSQLDERKAWISWLVAQDRIPDAHARYRAYVGISAAAPVYDGTFKQARPFSPFGWTLANQPEDYGERVVAPGSAAAMRLHASGKNAVVLLEQTLALAQGSWSIRLTGRDGGLGSPAGQVLSMRCLGQDRPLARLPLAKLRANQSDLVMPVTVPADCALQRLAIEAEPGESGASEIEIFSVGASRL